MHLTLREVVAFPSAAGHRRYTQEDLLRLQQVLSLRKLGFPLSEIAAGVRQVYREQPDAAQRHGMPLDAAMFEYIGVAMGEGRGALR